MTLFALFTGCFSDCDFTFGFTILEAVYRCFQEEQMVHGIFTDFGEDLI